MRSDKNSGIADVLRYYLRGRYSPETEEKVQEWLAKIPETEDVELASKEFWDSIIPGRNESTFDALGRVNKQIGFSSGRTKVKYLGTFSRIAAVFILLLGMTGVLLYLHHHFTPDLIEVSASYGETKQVILPDKTEVILNSGSSVKYPSEFNRKIRPVRLKGEAFFSVTKDKLEPFIVETERLTVRVLGTKFNLKAYPEENQTVATLEEGKIEISTADQQKQQLVPNEQLIFNNQTSKLKVLKISPDDFPEWKNGDLIFSDAALGEILQTLKRHFNISLDIDKSIDLSAERYTIKFKRDEKPEQIFQVLEELAGGFSYSKESGQIVLRKK